MTISIFKLTLEFRGGLHGEESASHDDEKKQQEVNGTRKAKRSRAGDEVNEGQEDIGSEADDVGEDRQSQPSDEDASQSVEKSDGGMRMNDGTSNLPKTGGQLVQVLGKLFNDTRITNVLMLVLVLIGMGGAEAVQSQMCSL